MKPSRSSGEENSSRDRRTNKSSVDIEESCSVAILTRERIFSRVESAGCERTDRAVEAGRDWPVCVSEGNLANGSRAHFVHKVLSFAVYGGVEEFAERVEEEDPGQHTGENLELRIVMLQMHEFVSDHCIGLLVVEEGQETARQEDASLFPPHRQRDHLIRFDQTKAHGRDTFEFSQPIDVLLNPRRFIGKFARSEPPDHGRVPEPPYEHGDYCGESETPNDRPEDGERNPVP